MKKTAKLPAKERFHGMEEGYPFIANKDGDHGGVPFFF
jgi:hypothetical protein